MPENEILTSRLLLRPIQLTDAPSIYKIRTKEHVHENFLTACWTDPNQATTWIHNVTDRATNLMFTIALQTTPSEIIGVIGLNQWDSLFYMLHPSSWNQGYCTEALHAFLPALWAHQPERRILDAAVMEGNEASLRVLEKCGFVRGTRKRHEEQQRKQESLSSEVSEDEAQVEGKEKGMEKDEEEEGVDIYVKRKLSQIEEDELKNAIQRLNVQVKPGIEPVRTTTDGAVWKPRKSVRLLGHRFTRKDVD